MISKQVFSVAQVSDLVLVWKLPEGLGFNLHFNLKSWIDDETCPYYRVTFEGFAMKSVSFVEIVVFSYIST